MPRNFPMRSIPCRLAAIGLAGLIAAATPATAQAAILLQDNFAGPTLATPGAVGNGFAVGAGSASASGGLASVGGGNGADQNIYSLDTFNPTGTTLTWQVNSRPSIGAAGVMIGWAQPGIYTCAGCGPEIWLEARNDRTVFDVVDSSGVFRYVANGPIGGTGPLTMDLTLTATTWQFDVIGSGSISASGTFVSGFGIADVISAAGGNLSAFASVRSDCPACGDIGTFSSVTVATPAPEPSTLLLLAAGFAGIAVSRRKPS